MCTTKEVLKVEFRYNDKDVSIHKKKTITIGIFDTLAEAVNAGNNTLNTLSKSFEVRKTDKFKSNGLFGKPDRLVTNTCYSTNGVEYFANIEQLHFKDVNEVVNEFFKINS